MRGGWSPFSAWGGGGLEEGSSAERGGDAQADHGCREAAGGSERWCRGLPRRAGGGGAVSPR